MQQRGPFRAGQGRNIRVDTTQTVGCKFYAPPVVIGAVVLRRASGQWRFSGTVHLHAEEIEIAFVVCHERHVLPAFGLGPESMVIRIVREGRS